MRGSAPGMVEERMHGEGEKDMEDAWRRGEGHGGCMEKAGIDCRLWCD